MGLEKTWVKLLKELSIALINAVVLSGLIFAYTKFKGSDEALTATVGVAMFSVVVFASLFGTFIPLLLNRLKIDPAVATGPFITTSNDIIGMFIYFSIGQFLFTLLS